MGTDHLVVLRTTSPAATATKRWRWNSTTARWERTSSYSAGAWFTAREMPIASLRDLAAAVEAIRRDPRAFIVRGVLADWAREAIATNPQQQIRRRKLLKQGIAPSLVEVPLPWMMIDIDGWPLPAWADLADDPDSVVEAAISALLPEAFHDVECYWHLSSSAGFVTDVLKVHLFFWLTEPASNAQVKAVLRHYAPSVDLAPYNAAQPHYIADSIVEGAPDPLPRRTGWRKGSDAAVVLPPLRPVAGRSRTSGFRAGRGSDLGGSIVEALATLGDGEGRHGFHEPLRRATLLYAKQCRDGDARDDDAFKAHLFAAVRGAPWNSAKRDGVGDYLDDAYLDRLIDGAFDFWAAKPEQPAIPPHFLAPTMDLGEASLALHAAIAEFLQRATGWHVTAPEQRGVAEHAAIRAITGLGKSRIARERVIAWIAAAKVAGFPFRVLWLVPTHKLGAEAETEFLAIGAKVAVFRGREQPDPTQAGFSNPEIPQVPLCLNLEAVNEALSIGAEIETEVCGSLDGPHCPYRASCGYQRQKRRVAEADIVIAAHNYLFHQLPEVARDGIGLVIIDEAWWQHGLEPGREVRLAGFADEPLLHPVLREQRHGDDPANATLLFDEAATNDLHVLSARVQQVLETTAEGEFVSKAAAQAIGLTANDCAEAVKLEWRRKWVGVLRPGMPPQKRKEAIRAAKGNSAIGRRVGVWRALQELLEGEQAHTGRLQLAIGGDRAGVGRVVLLHRRRPILDAIAELPILALDATLPLEVVQHFLPRLRLVADVQALAPHQAVTVITGGWGKTSLVTHGRAEEAENRRRQRLGELLRDFVALQSQGNGVVITYQDFESVFADVSGVQTAHFNAIAGLDEFRDVGFLTVIGRPLPAPDELRALALALTGRAIPAEQPHMETRGVLMTDGTGVGINCRVYTHPDLEMIRAAVTDAEVLQAIGRTRGVRRTAENPVTIFICADVVLPVVVECVVTWKNVVPNLFERMAARGVVLTSPEDLASCFPNLCRGSVEATKKAMQRDGKYADFRDIPLCIFSHRGMSPKYPYFPFRYRPVGRGQQTRQAWFNPRMVPNLRAWLEERLGPLAFFEMTIDGNATATSTIENSPMPHGTDDSVDGLDPSSVYPPMMLLAQPTGLWCTANGMRIVESARPRIVREQGQKPASPRAVSLLRYAERHLERVSLEWSEPLGYLVRRDEPQSSTPAASPSLIVLIHSSDTGV